MTLSTNNTTMIEDARGENADDRGFSLIELLVVIVILGVLSAVAVLGVTGVAAKGNKAACQTDVATIQTAADAYFVQHNASAPDLPTLVADGLLRADPKIPTTVGTLTRGNALVDPYTVTYAPATPVTLNGGNVTGAVAGVANCGG